MSSALTDWGAQQFLSWILNITSTPADFWVALCLDEPGTLADGTSIVVMEPDPVAGYLRQPVSLGPSSWTAPDGVNYSTNVLDIDFGVPLDSWGAITHFALCSDATEGDVYLYGEFDLPAEVDSSVQFIIPVGSLIIALESYNPAIVTM
jgi:hypothetical protein